MNTVDIIAVLHWWGLFFVLSLVMLPLTSSLFSAFFDRGYIFSKSLGIITVSYLALLLGTIRLLPFSMQNLWIIVLLLLLVNYGVLFFVTPLKKIPSELTGFLKQYGILIILEEVLFLLTLFFLAFIRSFSPDIHGLEKYMDYGFMNSIFRSEYFPPKDMWLTPFYINYYYFGHFTGAVLTKLSGLSSSVTYNLILASVFAMSFVGSFSIGANLFQLIALKRKFISMKRFVAGMLTACLVTLSGNLHTLYSFFKPYQNESPVPLWQLQFLPTTFPNSYWYPNATRFIYNTIHEFPMYSWVVADLHGHVFDIPFVILILAVLLSILIKSQNTNTKSSPIHHNKQNSKRYVFPNWILFGTFKFELWYVLLISFLLSVMYMTNAWDGLIYLLLSGLFIFYIQITDASKGETGLGFLFKPTFLLPLILSGITLFLGFIIFSLPFSLHFKPFVSGIGVLCAPEFLVNKGSLGPLLFEASHCQRSPWWQLVTLYGFFYFFIFSFLAFLSRVKNVRTSDTFILLIIILGTFLIIIPEFIYVKDIYPAHYRANTMFKLVFQSFVILSIASAYSIVRIISAMRSRRLALLEKLPSAVFLFLTAGLLLIVFIYPFQAVNSYYGNLETYSGLDGIKYVDKLYPTDYQGILWLRTHISGQPVILEAQGDSYTDFARVSANTGLPTVLGWTVHEWLWRNAYDVPHPPADPDKIYEEPAPRISEVQTLYETDDPEETKRLLRKYNVEYVFLGVLERQKYPNLNEEKWDNLGTQVFKHGITTIYKITH
jgi:uncharacterized membrane protein